MKKSFLCVVLAVVVITLSFSGCNFSEQEHKTFESCEVGEIYMVSYDVDVFKLNDNFVLNRFPTAKDDIVYKIRNTTESYIFVDSEEYYRGHISKCYCSNKYILLCLENSQQCVLLDCDSKKNIVVYDNIKDVKIDYSDFDVVDVHE